MKYFLLIAIAACTSIKSIAQLDSVIWEVYYEDDGTIPGYPAGFKTYRIYALLNDSNDKLLSFGNLLSPDSEFNIGSSTNRIWNNTASGVLEQAFFEYSEFSYEALDSYLTIGKTLENNQNFGANGTISLPPEIVFKSFSKSYDLLDSIQWNLRPQRFKSDPIFNADLIQINANSLYFLVHTQSEFINGAPNASDNRVLFAQITTDGLPMYSINLQLLDGATNSTLSYCFDPINNEQIDGVDKGLCYPVGSCGSYFGCSDPLACNYDFNAISDSTMCIYGLDCFGCTHSAATNYNPFAVEDDSSCVYELDFNFYYDYNGDGNFDWNEPFAINGLSGNMLSTGEISNLTNEYMNFSNVPSGMNIIQFQSSLDNSTTISNGMTQLMYLPDPSYIQGYTFSNYSYWGIDFSGLNSAVGSCYVALTTNMDNYNINENLVIPPFLCNSPSIHTSSILNQSNVDVYVTTELIIDTLYQNIIEASTADSIVGNHIYYSWDSLASGQLENELFTLLTPLAEYAGQTVTIEVHTLVYAMNDSLVIDTTTYSSRTIQCSYDPNSKEASPTGYSEYNFILEGTPIDYTINFQNTGNASAQTVLLADSIDLSKLDIASFEVISASHDFEQTWLNNVTIQFLFENINLPDSTSNEAESHGHITYKINAKENLQGWDQIHNTAYIYFDNNPAIVTNTTMHTIYDCAWLSTLPDYDDACLGEYTTPDFGAPYVENYNWALQGELLADETPTITLDFNIAGEYDIYLLRSNALCSGSAIFPVIVHPTPDVIINYNNTTQLVEGMAGYNYMWYVNGQLIVNETSNAIDPWLYTIDAYSIYAIVTSDFGCVGTTNTIFESAVFENANISLSLFPNPMEDFATLKISNGNWKVELFNSLGQKVNEWNNIQNTLQITNENLSSGAYMVRVMNEQGISGEVMMVVR